MEFSSLPGAFDFMKFITSIDATYTCLADDADHPAVSFFGDGHRKRGEEYTKWLVAQPKPRTTAEQDRRDKFILELYPMVASRHTSYPYQGQLGGQSRAVIDAVNAEKELAETVERLMKL